MISIDSLRLDHVGRAAQSRVHTPRFDRLADGFAFSECCFSVSSATRPVHTSLVTGLYPFEHGIQGQQDGRVRQGAPRLFRQCSEGGFDVGLFSEAATIFTGLDLGAPVEALAVDASSGLEQVRRWLQRDDRFGHRCLFLHYWSAHTPYGAADGRALGETAALLRQGRLEEVHGRYRRTVEDVFENKVAPLLETLDLGRWSVLLFGDHGESWTPEEFYHGMTVRNSVLRVPLYLHVPYSGNPQPGDGGVVSLVDLYATVCGLLGLPRQDDGFGIDLLGGDSHRAMRMAEIRPGRDAGQDWVDTRAEQGMENQPQAPLRWCVFDDRYRLHGENEDWRLETQWTELPVGTDTDLLAAPYLRAWKAFRTESKWLQRPLAEGPMSAAEEDALRRRLQALGYL
ncbi:uncharacterized protein METZ01_LOCUS162015 [marine metagenome]|uniref:Sulfatase N-terminal domain-containing protein n=1 Tax=marine metagenome TaxID=408172 RepID=A0A382B6M5_9ZZZZ